MSATLESLKPDLTRICPTRGKRDWLVPHLARLEKFVTMPEFQNQPPEEQALLKRELVTMRELLEILDRRIALSERVE